MISVMTTSLACAVLGVGDGMGVGGTITVQVAVLVGKGVLVRVAVAVALGVHVAVGAVVSVAVDVGSMAGLAAPGEPRSPALPGQRSGAMRQLAPLALSRSVRINIMEAPSGLGKAGPPS